MKKYLLFALFLALFAKPGVSQNDCGLFITTDYSSECILTEYDRKPESVNDESTCFHVCQGEIVQYYATGLPGGSFTWNVQGSNTWQLINGGEGVSITWPSDIQSATVTVTGTNPQTGQSCTFTRCIEMIQSPDAGIITIPEADTTGTYPVLQVCRDQVVQFNDNSYGSAEAPITGYLWEWNEAYPTATSQNTEVSFSQPGEYTLDHTVVNECGCEDVQRMIVVVSEAPALELDCYGTACAFDEVSYEIINSQCHDYSWEIIGGTLISFNYPTLTIQWDSPASGYGQIRLDGTDCDNLCEDNTYINVPIMTDSVLIDGPEEVCVGDYVVYEMPLFAATEYTWNISTPDSSEYNYQYPNQQLVCFDQPGTYYVNVDYENEVLPDCGEFSATELEVQVKDTFEIDGPKETCKNTSVDFYPNVNDTFDWTIQDESGNTIHTASNVDTLSYSFSNDGDYLISASNNTYCKESQTYISVNPSPSTLPLDSITGDHFVCPSSSVLYSAQPGSSQNYIGWYCPCATPDSWNGENFTANFDSIICDVGVYQVNQLTGCISDTTWYSVEEFQPSVNTISVPPQACANDTFSVSVQPESHVLYEWSISPQSAASIVGDVYEPQTIIQTNNIDSTTLNVTLMRWFCDNKSPISETVPVVPTSTPTINLDSVICENDSILLTVENSAELNGTFQWDVNGTLYSGLNIYAIIDFTGEFTVSLTYSPASGCESVTVGQTCFAMPAPNASLSVYQDGMTVAVQDEDTSSIYAYQWTTGDTVPTISTNPSTTYTCTVTNNDGCQSIVSGTTTAEDTLPGANYGQLNILTADHCGYYEWEVTGYMDTIHHWTISGPSGASNQVNGADNNQMEAWFDNPGLYLITATGYNTDTTLTVWKDSIAIPCKPAFEISTSCDNSNSSNLIVCIEDLTAYLDNTNFISSGCFWRIDGSVQNSTCTSLPAGQTYFIELSKQYTYTHPVTGEIYSDSCTVSDSVYLHERGIADFSIQDDPNFCVSTPVVFNDLSTGDIIRWEWEFDDNATLIGQDAQRTYNVPDPDYQPSLTITDAYGCTDSAQQSIGVAGNVLTSGSLGFNGGPFCAGSAWELEYNWEMSPPSNVDYIWMPENDTTFGVTTHDVTQTGDYYVLLEDENNCRAQSNMINLGFLNTPTANIHGRTSYCPGEEVLLLGNTGDQFDYIWSATGPNGFWGDLFFSSEPNFTYQAAPVNTAGSWNNVLTVQIDHSGVTCSDSDNVTSLLHEAGPAPDIDFGNNACLTYGPVDMISNSGSVYWSNGTVGNGSQYFNPGIVNAYQIDDSTGCQSEVAEHFIQPPPDFDAILSGCYDVCHDFFENSIYAYINPLVIPWDWIYNQNSIASGSSISTFLPLVYFGDYHLETNYGDNCISHSHDLSIVEKPNCDADSVEIGRTRLACKVIDCELVYQFDFLVQNNYSSPIQITDIYYTGAVTIDEPSYPVNIAAYGSTGVYLDFIPPLNYLQSMTVHVEFELNGVTYIAYASTHTDSLINPNDCFDTYCSATLEMFQESYHDNSTYVYEFAIQFNPGMQNVSLQPEYGDILNYNYDANSGIAEGMLSISNAFQSNYCADTTDADFCIAITGCRNDRYCTDTVCLPHEHFCVSKSSGLALTDSNTLYEEQADMNLCATPNPIENTVRIEGTGTDHIARIHCLDLQGNYVKSTNDLQMNLADCKPGVYFLRIDLKKGNVIYLKIIKK